MPLALLDFTLKIIRIKNLAQYKRKSESIQKSRKKVRLSGT